MEQVARCLALHIVCVFVMEQVARCLALHIVCVCVMEQVARCLALHIVCVCDGAGSEVSGTPYCVCL